MRVLLTGARGTLGPHLARALELRGHTCVAWDRSAAPPDDPSAVARLLDATDADAVAHLALGAEAWAEALAAWCATRARPLVYTSSVMVFGDDPDGPHRPGDERTARDEYGRYKARCEDRVRAAHAGACVARLGWQIGVAPGGNEMLAHLGAQHARDGALRPSRRWIPACSFLPDTADALAVLLAAPVAGVVHLDGNAETAWDFARVVEALQRGPGDAGWRVEPDEAGWAHDQRLLDDVPRVAPLAARLPS